MSTIENFYIKIEGIVADFNNDRIFDVAIIDLDYEKIRILYGNGDGTFVMRTSVILNYNSKMRKIFAGDINSDGYNDIIVTSTNLVGFVICYGNADGDFIEKTISSTETTYIPNSIIISDLNNDNYMDIVVLHNSDRNIYVYLGYGNESFDTRKASPVGGYNIPEYMTVGDFNEDGILDVIVTQLLVSSVTMMFGYGNGRFGNKIKLILNPDFQKLATPPVTVVDFNRDDHLDIAACQGTSCTVTVFYGDGNSSFERDIMLSTRDVDVDNFISAADLNGDNYPDIISFFDFTLEIFLNADQCGNIAEVV